VRGRFRAPGAGHRGRDVNAVLAGAQVVMVAGGGGAVGVLGGGFLGQRLHALWRPAMPVVTGACVVAASWPVWAIINSGARGSGALPGFMALGFLGAMLASPPGPNARRARYTLNLGPWI